MPSNAQAHPDGYTLTLFNLDGTFNGCRYTNEREPAEENVHTIRARLLEDAQAPTGLFIATMERHATGGTQSRLIEVFPVGSVTRVAFPDEEAVRAALRADCR